MTADDTTDVTGLPTSGMPPTTGMPTTGTTGSDTGTATEVSDSGSTTATTSTTDPPPTTSDTTSGGVCGDGERQTGEECDGDDLAGATCEDLGFPGGTLACGGDCTVDTTGCFQCGNDAVEGDEQCDGAELDGADCISEGFLGGTLTCAPDCTLETTGCTPALYFSEYAEGTSNNKALEIFNASPSEVELATCEVRFYFAPSAMPGNTLALMGTLPSEGTYVICDDSIDPGVYDPMDCDLLAAGSFYNGDDTIELFCNGTTLDVFGQIGTDPGTEWAAGGVGTQDETLRRDCLVTMGDDNGADPFNPATEWETFPLNDFSDFGQYMCP